MERVKIVAYSNFNDESVSDVLVADNVHGSYAKTMLQALSAFENERGTYCYKIVPLDYKLYEWDPNS